ncbi:flagellar protein FlaF [uncultured Gammaproteobacteria bacterium]
MSVKPTQGYVNRPSSDDPRDTESWALSEASRRLIDASRNPSNTEAFQNALMLNQRLWTIFQVAISEDDCQLPRELRENLAALSLMVDRETVKRLVDLDASKIDILIQVNRTVASGLNLREQAAAQAATATPTRPTRPPAAAAPRTAAESAKTPLPPRGGVRISI